VRIVRISSDYAPGVQALFAKFSYGDSFQMLGTGVRMNSAVAAPQKDIIVSFVERESGNEYRLTALYDAATASGPWTLYGADGALFDGTLTKFDCAQPDPRVPSPELGGAGLLQP
jgi:hypothetical protein